MVDKLQKVKFLDVGHGDSSIIYLYNDDSEIENVSIIDIVDSDKMIELLNKDHIRVIDLIIISHSDADHCRGVGDFVEKFSEEGIIKKIYFNLDKRSPTKMMGLYLKKILELNRKYKIELHKGQLDSNINEKELLSNKNSSLNMIYPNIVEETEAYLKNSTNDASIVCLLKSRGCNVLFAGDLEDGWSHLLERCSDLKCDILKMPHHGAFYTDKNKIETGKILDRLTPEVAIISSGENRKYKHPSPKTIEILKENKIKIFCTEYTSLCHCNTCDYEKKCYGNIEVISNELTYEICCEQDNAQFLQHAVCCN